MVTATNGDGRGRGRKVKKSILSVHSPWEGVSNRKGAKREKEVPVLQYWKKWDQYLPGIRRPWEVEKRHGCEKS